MPGYVGRDWSVIDYKCYKLDGTDLWFRGPAPGALNAGEYFSVIGAAQTFGCFCEKPYSALLSERLNMNCLNLGYSGAGPSFFALRPELLRYINRGAFCIVQIMSARSTGNSLLDNDEGLGYGRRTRDRVYVTAETVFDELIRDGKAKIPVIGDRWKNLLLRLLRIPVGSVRRIMRESRRNWLHQYVDLFNAIAVPKVLLWFSKRRPFYIPSYHERKALFGAFPHMVDRKMVRRIKSFADYYVECVTERGMPQVLIDRFTGLPTSIDLSADVKRARNNDTDDLRLYSGIWQANRYYPSPEMHVDAANALFESCARMLATVAHYSQKIDGDGRSTLISPVLRTCHG